MGGATARLFSYRLYRRAVASACFPGLNSGSAGETDLVLKGRLLAFEETATPQGTFGTVVVEADLLTGDETLLWRGTVEKRVPVGGDGAAASIDAITKAAEETITALLSSIEQALQQAETPPSR
jgi:ABC-type uncharacterized transport system auxiliary subunit